MTMPLSPTSHGAAAGSGAVRNPCATGRLTALNNLSSAE